MYKSTLVFFIFLISTNIFAQKGSGLTVEGGFALQGGMTFSSSYFHPLIMKQFYVDGGFRYFNTMQFVTDDIFNRHFSKINQVFAGVRLGDRLFANPRIALNWYGKYTSPGWGFSGGILIHVSDQFFVGFSINYDQIRFDTSVDKYGTTKLTSISVVMNWNIFD